MDFSRGNLSVNCFVFCFSPILHLKNAVNSFSTLVCSESFFFNLLLNYVDEQLVEVVFKRTAVHWVILRSKSPKTVSFKETGPFKKVSGT